MADIADTVNEAIEKAQERDSKLNTAVAACVAVAATFMALCNVKDGNVVQAMQSAQANSVDAWAYFQAKSTKQSMAEQMADALVLERDAAFESLSPERRALFEKKIAEYTEKAKTYEREKGEIKSKAEGYQKEYEALNVHDDQFDMAEASLSISIALFGVTALTHKRWLLFIGGVFAFFGTAVGLAGFLGLEFHPDFFAKLLS